MNWGYLPLTKGSHIKISQVWVLSSQHLSALCFADDIDCLAGQKQELVKLVNHLEEASTAYGMQLSAEKTQLMTNNTNGISTDSRQETGDCP